MDVKITENMIKPVCNIKITVYDNNGKKVNQFKHKKKFRKISKSKSTSKYYKQWSGSVWTESRFSGVPIPTIIDIYIQTLDELIVEKNFHL